MLAEVGNCSFGAGLDDWIEQLRKSSRSTADRVFLFMKLLLRKMALREWMGFAGTAEK
jgi:hypothetical protein